MFPDLPDFMGMFPDPRMWSANCHGSVIPIKFAIGSDVPSPVSFGGGYPMGGADPLGSQDPQMLDAPLPLPPSREGGYHFSTTT